MDLYHKTGRGPRAAGSRTAPGTLGLPSRTAAAPLKGRPAGPNIWPPPPSNVRIEPPSPRLFRRSTANTPVGQPAPRRVTRRITRWIAVPLLALAGAVCAYQLVFLANVVSLIWFNPSTSAFMETRLEALQERDPDTTLRHRWVPYERISINLKRAMIAAEDARFLEHDGFDWEAIVRAYEKNVRRGKVIAGGSTISQQLAKNLFLSADRTPWRKAQEAVITLMIESLLSKRRIFEIYLNIVEWGNRVYGAEAASRYYFQTSAASLDAVQAARLAAMVPRPRYYERVGDTPVLERRTWIILRRMWEAQVP